MLDEDVILKIGIFIISFFVVICIGVWEKRRLDKNKRRASVEEPSNGNRTDRIEKADDNYTSKLNTNSQTVSARVNYASNLNMNSQTVSAALNKIVELYGDRCKLNEADANGLFTEDNSFAVSVTEHLDEIFITFGRDSFTLFSIIEFLISPVESRKPYSYSCDDKLSVVIGSSSELNSVCSDSMLNIMLTFIDLQEKVQNKMVMLNFAPSANFKFSRFKYFSNVDYITIFITTLHSNTFKDMENFEELKSLTIAKGTKLVGDTGVKVSIAKLSDIAMIEMEEKEVEHFLHAVDKKYNDFVLSIIRVNLTNTQAISKLSCLSSLFQIDLRSIVFKEIPDFTFIKKATGLTTLHMEDIFYGYEEKYEESSFTQIRKNIEYLNVSQVQRKYSTYSEQEKRIIDENRKVGESIRAMWVYMNKNIYDDLGISSLSPDVSMAPYIQIVFPLLKDSNFSNVSSYEVLFSMEADGKRLHIVSVADSYWPDYRAFACLSDLVFPFGSYMATKHIFFHFEHEIKISEVFMDFFIESVYLYPHSDLFENIKIETSNTIDVDINTIIEYGKKFKGLAHMEFVNVELAQTIIKKTNEEGVDDMPKYEVCTNSNGIITDIKFLRDN
ncbi:hypothetical protein NEMIN01_2327 [Nematocida minor]|uniref:uncharacterized protein n=1 Tax=Nematocida minor TaxID=1912983 RepID=UPI00221E3A32|nr:uncharacterized protein NEMIN01_2327 [Nematocida minor]KAI5192975.1 hypothetical protein NEMIN01_2327 [Nematocida minor]